MVLAPRNKLLFALTLLIALVCAAPAAKLALAMTGGVVASATSSTGGLAFSFIDMGAAYPAALGRNATVNGTCGAIFSQPSATATTTGGRLSWSYSGSGTDAPTVYLYTSGNVQIGHAPLSFVSSSTVTFSWAEGTIPLTAYTFYGVSVNSTVGYSRVNSNSVNAGNAFNGNSLATGAPPWPGAVMPGKNFAWWISGIQYTTAVGPFGQGGGSAASYCPVEPIISP